ncbi:MAG: MBL fold metallo-hydrolase [Acidobacteriia bacterium]|nr:MBL fold metallo-hydrolase [Terriglobia bacterium]
MKLRRARLLLTATGVAVACVLLVWWFWPRILDEMIRWKVRSLVNRYQTAILRDDKLHVVFCGTGTPPLGEDPAMSSVAIIAAGTFVVFDTGPGSTHKADRLGLPLGELSAVFLTHVHADHIADLGELAEESWRDGRVSPLTVYGPSGTARVVAGFREVYALDVQFRLEHRGEVDLPARNALPVAHEIEIPEPDAAVQVFESPQGLRISAFLVDHAPVKPAFGYRIEYRGRVVVISGDTRACPNLVRHASNADLLIHEAVITEAVDRIVADYQEEFAAANEPGDRNLARNLTATRDFHTSISEAAEEAAAANVHTLVLTHLKPSPGSPLVEPLLRSWILRPVREHFRGEVVIARDGMRFSLEPRR